MMGAGIGTDKGEMLFQEQKTKAKTRSRATTYKIVGLAPTFRYVRLNVGI